MKFKFLKSVFTGLILSASCIANAGLIGHWDANGNAQDSTGNNNGTLEGNTTFTTGNDGQAFLFDGNSDSVLVGTTLDVSTGFSLSAWINPLSYGERQIFNNESSYEMAVRGSTLQFAIETDAAGGWFWVDTGINVSLNSWSFFGLTYDGISSKIYGELGQQLFSTNVISGNVIDPANDQVHIGARLGNTSSFHGSIDDVYVFDHALTANDIALVASNSYSDVPEPSTLAIFALGMIGLASRRFKK